MKSYFDQISFSASRMLTKRYSTSFASSVHLLAPSIRQDIYNIYSFVRLADEIVDSFQGYPQAALFYRFKQDLILSLEDRISTNPILNAFQHTVNQYAIPWAHIEAFMNSMEQDLSQKDYNTRKEFEAYIYGSADVVGLMCLRVFVAGDEDKFKLLEQSAMRLGSAFQKINFLRDIKDDLEILERRYFPKVDLASLSAVEKSEIIDEIREDLRVGYLGILELPVEAKLGVYMAYNFYKELLARLDRTPPSRILQTRVRVPNYQKIALLAKCYANYKLRMI
ncbi:phytoene/squalene synthase family protein [Flavobacterium caeni]|uniref:Phytoene/squalene synthetase n=1 Tax=Flavobacterium caeni TaxID=490189 RepID=A0A1G5HRB9_9FLAO|nr:phytoene/squalene synthase family protein [Flavobacterium caeni]SCY66432.1 Phytoene/squalene synthetase [Flavobacterium caeni]